MKIKCFMVCVLLCLMSIMGTIHASDINYDSNDIVTLYGEVNATTAAKAILQIQAAQKTNNLSKPILFFINSPGGQLSQGTQIIDAMLASKRPIYTIDIGLAASMAAYIHSYGTKRLMFPHAVLMYHNASTSLDGDVNHIKNRLIMVLIMMNDLNQNVSSRSGVPLSELTTRENSEWWVTSSEALNRHLVDGVVNVMNYPIVIPQESPSTDSKKK